MNPDPGTDGRPDSLSADDVRQLAAMHCEILPDSLVSRVGPEYARSFYRHVGDSDREFAFLHRDRGTIVSACIVSLEPHTLQRRLLLHTPLILHAPLAIRRLPVRAIAASLAASVTSGMRAVLASRSAAPGRSAASRHSGDSPVQPRGPEVLLIFTLAQARGTGLGAATMARCEAFLRARHAPRYFVKTLDDESNRAIAFYRRRGFTQLGTVVKNGKPLGVWEKHL